MLDKTRSLRTPEQRYPERFPGRRYSSVIVRPDTLIEENEYVICKFPQTTFNRKMIENLKTIYERYNHFGSKLGFKEEWLELV